MTSDQQDELCSKAVFLGRVVRQEGLDILEELRVSRHAVLESVRALRELESLLNRVEQELELSDAVKGVEDSVDQIWSGCVAPSLPSLG